jgi:DNA end-binding protein Ku
MAARPIGSGTISFGLVSIPVKLFSTVDTTKTIHFNYLSKDGSRLKQQYIRASDGEVVERSEQVQGYEFSKGQYVIFTPDEIKAFNVVATNAIDITEFVPLESIERIYIEKVYYLGPDKGAARSYHLLKQALGTTGRAALANYAARGKSYLVLIRPMGDGLVMEQLKHEEELRPFNEVPLDHVEVKDAELDLAIKIIEQRTNDKFEPDKYTDEIRAKILAMIEEKVEGRAIAVPPEEKPEAKIIDLMEALRASVGEKRDAAPRRPAKRAAKAAVESPQRAVPAGPQSKASKTSKRSTS